MTYDELTASLPPDIANAFILAPGYIGADSVDLILYITENQITVTPNNYLQVAQSFRQWYEEIAPNEYHDPPSSYVEIFGGWGHGGWRPGAGGAPGTGRPALPEGERRVQVSVRLHPANLAWLDAQATSRSKAIDELIEAARDL